MTVLGRPRLHLRRTDSTNAQARALAAAGAPHGTLVTAREQTAGRGRQGRSWAGPPGRSLLLSVLVRDFDHLLPLRAGLAVADVAGDAARVKWPNDVLLEGGKLAGILVEGRPQEGWAVIGIGLNVAVRREDLPPEVRDLAASLGRPVAALEPTLAELLRALARRLDQAAPALVADLRRRDALLGRSVRWAGGSGEGAGVGADGRLLVRTDGEVRALDAGEVHLGTGAGIDALMDHVIVRRHGTRWAVLDSPDTAPSAEYETRELAEMAARQAAGGRQVVVEEDTGDEQLGTGGGLPADEDDVRGADAGIDGRTSGAGSGTETPREPQAGL
jgi:BirA family biotin operon repressor/biotin-[acetyl-CoA-carboxylase] ligase